MHELAKIRFVRLTKRLIQWDIARKTGINPSRISLMERGYIAPREAEKQKLAETLGLDLTELEQMLLTSSNPMISGHVPPMGEAVREE